MTLAVWWSITALIVAILFGMAFEKDDQQDDPFDQQRLEDERYWDRHYSKYEKGE